MEYKRMRTQVKLYGDIGDFIEFDDARSDFPLGIRIKGIIVGYEFSNSFLYHKILVLKDDDKHTNVVHSFALKDDYDIKVSRIKEIVTEDE